MAANIPASQIAQRIEQLVEERQQHADAIARIDQILGGISAALAGTSTHANGKEPATTAPKSPIATGKRRRGRGHFALSAEESILAFVKVQKNPTSSDISGHLKGEGRSTSANNALGKLVKEKKLRREPLKDQRGSRYLLA